MGIESVLKAGLKALPEKEMQGQQAINLLKKRGVKDEELQFSGVEIQPDKKYSKQDLVTAEENRKDVFGKTEPANTSYNWVSLEAGKSNPTYKENVYTMADKGAEGSRYTSEHFPDVPNYLMHTRTFDDTVDGVPTRVVQEIQSDLHQQGRVSGYGDNGLTFTPREEQLIDDASTVQMTLTGGDDDEALEYFGVTARELQAEYDSLVARSRLSDIDRASMSEEEILVSMYDDIGGVPKSPYEKSWLAKGIEREVDQAIKDGRQQIAIPIKGAEVSNLKRAEGVQKWYEGNVVNTAKKIAKQNGMDFELKTIDGTTTVLTQAEKDVLQMYSELSPDDGAFDSIFAAVETVANSHNVPFTPDGLDSLMTGTNVEPMQYAIIKPKGRLVEDQAYEDKLVEFNNMLDDGANLESKRAERLMDELGIPTNVDPEDWMVDKFAELERTNATPQKFEAKRPNLKLYSSPAAAVGAGYASLKAGGTEDDVRFELSQAGYDSDEAEEILADAKFAVESVDVHGDSEEEVMNFFKSQEPEIAEVSSAPLEQPVKSFWDRTDDVLQAYNGNPKQEAFGQLISDEKLNAEQLLSHLQTISPNMTSITTRISGYFGSETSAKAQEEAVTAAAQRIVNLAQEHGISMAFQPNAEGDGIDQLSAYGGGKWFAQGPDGQAIPIDEGFWESMRQESHEITYGVTGAIGGAKAVSTVTKNPWAIALGSVVGAVTGAGIGTELDYLRDAVTLHEDMSLNVAAHKAFTAAEASVIGDVVGYPIAKGAGAIWSGAKRAKDFLLDGNTEGAYKALKDTMFLEDSEVVDIVTGLNKATSRDTSTMKPLEERIQATVLTQPGAEAIVKAAGSVDPQAGAAVAKAIDNRAQDIMRTTAELTDDNVGRILAQDLSNYTSDVKQYYGNVKELVAKSPRINDFEWDYEKLAIKPVLDTLQKNIMDPAVLERFALQSAHINSMADSRTLTDLLELRQLVNDFKFNKRITKVKDFDALNKVLGNIDGAIRQGAEVVMEEPAQWLSNYSLAKTQYAKMKGLERNVIARALRRPGLTEETAVEALAKYITAIDGSFQDVMSALPKESRKLTEGAVIDTLANKFAFGTEGGQRAMHFPLLAAELDKITFTMPEARKAKAALKEMAEVFKNDVPLSQSTGNIQIPKFQSYLTVDPVVRAKFEIASSMFNWIKKMAPTSEQRNMALVSKTAKLLENPLNARLMKEVMEDSGGDVQLSKQLMDLQRQAALAKDTGAAKIKLYGSGNVLSGKGSGTAVEIPIHRIATYEAQQTLANKYGIDQADKKLMDQALKGEGYMAVQQGSDKVRRLK